MAKNYWLKSGFYSLLNQLTQMVFNLGSFVLLLRVLDKETCSVWVIYMTIIAFLEVGRTGLLQNGLMTFLNQTDESEHAKINTASFFLSISLSLIFVILLLLLSPFVANYYGAKDLMSLLTIYAGTTFISSALYQFNFIQQANMDFKGLFWSSCVKNGGLFFYILFVKFTNSTYNLSNLALVQLLTTIPAALVAFGFARKYFKLSTTLDWAWVKKLLDYGKYTFGTNLSTMAYKSVDKMMLGRMLLGTLSTYDLSIKINNLAEVPTMTLASILFPQSAKRAGTEGSNSAKYLYEKSVGILLAIILPVVVVILLGADIIVQIIGSEKYASAAPVLRLTIFYGIFMAFAMQFGTILDSVGKPKLNFLITTLSAVTNLVFNYIFIKQFGLYGAAYGSLIAMSLMFAVMQLILRRLFQVDILNCFTYAMTFYKDFYGKAMAFLNKKNLKTA
ncbi:MAG: flippase [Saprospiraceae bacterium]|nr:flippase [Saprospiraceae bacterium]